MGLKEIFCQDRAIGTLQRAMAAGRVPHAYIFAGPEGVGKFTTAKEWAKLLLCEKPSTSELKTQNSEFETLIDSCGKCLSCIKFEAGSHPDFQRVYKELLQFTKKGKDKTTPIDLPISVINEFLVDKVGSRPTLSQRSVFVVEEAQRLNKESQNAMLKTLEEPPAYCSIILLCTRLEDLLPTTRSRCQIVTFGTIDENIIVEKLRQCGIEKEESLYWARFSQGSLGVALQWAAVKLDEGSIFATKKQLVERFASFELGDAVEFGEWLGRQAKEIAEAWEKVQKDTSTKDIGRRVTNGVLAMLAAALNDAMKLNVGTGERLINEDQRRYIGELARKYDAEAAAGGIEAIYKSMEWLDASVNEKLIFEELLLNLAANAIL
ncbi:MAG: DNA polymerase III subunit delta' C-terminal domain-containing protein [Sedimentisphaerales bacterium]|nr:DNA polymerase III subunit delta' C-terminal domain-containing protein [Sedimentisphaerales bacterium]